MAEFAGLVGEIRGSSESDQFDLNGYTEARAHDLIVNAFGTPLNVPTKMVKFTFVVGGGKLVRSRYSEELPKWLTTALREIGFTEDRSAAETFDSQGTYKQQHDTGQNLKYLIVYPRIERAGQSVAAEAESAESASALIDERSPEYMIMACGLDTLKEMVASKTQSWSQRKRLLKSLQDSRVQFQQIEAKLISGTVLSALEQAQYDANSGVDEEKIAWMQAECKRMVDEGKLTSEEKTEVLENITSNLQSLAEELNQAVAENKPKKVEKLQERKRVLEERRAVVDRTPPVVHRLRNSEEIQRIKVKLLAMHAIEDKGRSMSLTLEDLKKLEGKSDLEERLTQLENSSRCWFEESSEFNQKRALDDQDAARKYSESLRRASNSNTASKKPGSSSTSSSVSKSLGGMKISGGGGGGSKNAWSTVTSSSTKKASSSSSSTAAKKSGGASIYSAFGGDDSD